MYQMTIIWCMVPRIWTATDRIFAILDHFLPFYPTNTKNRSSEKMEKKNWRYHHFKKVYQKLWSYALLLLRYDAWQMQLFFILGYFFPFYPNNSSNNQNLTKNEKKTWKYHHFMQEYQKSWSYAIVLLRYACDRCNCYFSFWAIFCPFSPLTAQKV